MPAVYTHCVLHGAQWVCNWKRLRQVETIDEIRMQVKTELRAELLAEMKAEGAKQELR